MHRPRVRSVPEPPEREMFVEWHRSLLEEAGAVAPRVSGEYPRLVRTTGSDRGACRPPR